MMVRPTAAGMFARSPQCPGLVISRASLEELKTDLDDILAFYFNSPGPIDVLGHEENAREIDQTEVVVRCATDEHYRDRIAIADRVIAALRDSSQRTELPGRQRSSSPYSRRTRWVGSPVSWMIWSSPASSLHLLVTG